MNKNATLVSHLQNAAIAVLTVTAVLLLIQTPLVGDLAARRPTSSRRTGSRATPLPIPPSPPI